MASASSSSQPMMVRLSTMIGPAKFWAMPLPDRMQFDKDEEVQTTEETIDKVLNVEKQLGELYNSPTGEVQNTLRPEGSFAPHEVKEGMLVAVRHNVYSRHWYRGRILLIMTKNTVLARMFLIDYGDFLPEVPVRSCLRKLPKNMQIIPRPRAVQVILAGLRPISYDVNIEIGMQNWDKKVASEWSFAASSMVLSYYKKSKLKIGKITDWQKDAKGRVHGTLELLGFTEKIVLNDILIKAKYAIYSTESLKAELMPEFKESVSVRMGNLSICTDSSEDYVVMEYSDFCNQSFETNVAHESHKETPASVNVAKYGGRANLSRSNAKESIFEDSMFCPDEQDAVNPLMPLDPKTYERARRRKHSRSLNSSISSDFPKGSSQSGGSTDSVKSIWDDFRGKRSSDESDDDFEDDADLKQERKVLKKETKKKNAQVIRRLPAGVDRGKFLQEQLKRGQTEGLGPKRIPNPNAQNEPSSVPSHFMEEDW